MSESKNIKKIFNQFILKVKIAKLKQLLIISHPGFKISTQS